MGRRRLQRLINKPTVTVFFKLALSVGLVGVLFLTSSFTDFVLTVRNSDYRYFVISLGISFAAMLMATWRWKILLGCFNSKLDYFGLFKLIGLSYFYNFFIPGGVAGDLIRGVQCRRHQISGTQGVASVVVDRIIGLSSFALVGLVGSFLSMEALIAVFPGGWVWVLVAGLIIGGCVCFSRKIIGSLRILSSVYPAGFEKLKLLHDAVCEYKDHRSIAARALAVSLLTALSNILSFYLLSRAAGSDVGLVHFLIYIPIITVASYVPISYSGLGIRELCFVVLFGRVGMTTHQALAVPIMYFGMVMILSLAGGIIYWSCRYTGTLCHISAE
jgi:hypothetical protein